MQVARSDKRLIPMSGWNWIFNWAVVGSRRRMKPQNRPIPQAIPEAGRSLLDAQSPIRCPSRDSRKALVGLPSNASRKALGS